jgi:nitroimidazol reductase NimA-like FMN-containing flavoprotein (pyridoxamine 5'-phosphate oxidase superfamily)
MFIHEMGDTECRLVLQSASVGRLACARDNQPYVIPTHFAFHGDYIYGFSTFGQKVDWMRSNPLVCFEVDQITSDSQWVSIVVFGRYEELPDASQYQWMRAEAHKFLGKRAMWWEPAYISQKHRDQAHSLIPIFYRIRIEKMTGHRATLDNGHTALAAKRVATDKSSWLSKLFHLRN